MVTFNLMVLRSEMVCIDTKQLIEQFLRDELKLELNEDKIQAYKDKVEKLFFFSNGNDTTFYYPHQGLYSFLKQVIDFDFEFWDGISFQLRNYIIEQNSWLPEGWGLADTDVSLEDFVLLDDRSLFGNWTHYQLVFSHNWFYDEE